MKFEIWARASSPNALSDQRFSIKHLCLFDDIYIQKKSTYNKKELLWPLMNKFEKMEERNFAQDVSESNRVPAQVMAHDPVRLWKARDLYDTERFGPIERTDSTIYYEYRGDDEEGASQHNDKVEWK